MKKEYLGDGVYVEVKTGSLLLTTENGTSVQNEIYLEPEVLRGLVEYADAREKEAKALREAAEAAKRTLKATEAVQAGPREEDDSD